MRDTERTHVSRRRFLASVTAVGASVSIAGCGGNGDTTTPAPTTTADETTMTETPTTAEPTTTQETTEATTAEPTTTQSTEPIPAGTELRFGGITSGWKGREPQAIVDISNPTLRLQEGAEYTFWWENVDGAPHNVIIENEAGDNLVQTEIISSGTQSVTFTAQSEMASYYCEVHPVSMRGPVEVV